MSRFDNKTTRAHNCSRDAHSLTVNGEDDTMLNEETARVKIIKTNNLHVFNEREMR